MFYRVSPKLDKVSLNHFYRQTNLHNYRHANVQSKNDQYIIGIFLSQPCRRITCPKSNVLVLGELKLSVLGLSVLRLGVPDLSVS